MRKRIGALLLGLVLLMNGFSWEALAADGSGSLSEEVGDAPQSVEDIWINPMYQDVEDADSIRSALDGLQEESQEERAGAGSSLTFLSKAKAASSICRQMVERKSMVSVYVQAGNVNAKKLASTLFEQALAVGKGTAGDEGDYIRYHLGGYASSVMRYRYGTGKYMVTYVMRYYTTKQQERRVTAKVKSVLSSLGVKNKAAYGKIKAIYDYICRHVEYDRATLGDSVQCAHERDCRVPGLCQPVLPDGSGFRLAGAGDAGGIQGRSPCLEHRAAEEPILQSGQYLGCRDEKIRVFPQEQ